MASPLAPDAADGFQLDGHAVEIERRGDGAVLVRVRARHHSEGADHDAVFAFRAGDPQYGRWEKRLFEQQSRRAE